jgi:alkanesulfonate monooxygenase SsuD/methylene tetrahydromethanopterin reductase-like flavin-dependent oxidoreductase (luciferase family)
MGTGPVEQQQVYDAALRESGRNPDNFFIAQPRTVFVASRREKAWDAAEAGAHYMMSLPFTRSRQVECGPDMNNPNSAVSVRIRDLVWYYLRLGTLGFGGPIALCAQMEKELVQER